MSERFFLRSPLDNCNYGFYLSNKREKFNSRFFPANVFQIQSMTYENGNITLNCEVGEMNSDNLFRLGSYLRDNDYDIIDITNSMIFALSVVRIRFWGHDRSLAAKLPEILNIDVKDMFVVNEGLVFIKTRAFFKHYNDDGQLQIKQFDLMDYEFEQRFTTLNPICCQLRKNGIAVDTVDIWDDYLMIKSNCENPSLNHKDIKKALNIEGEGIVQCVKYHMLYIVERWK